MGGGRGWGVIGHQNIEFDRQLLDLSSSAFAILQFQYKHYRGIRLKPFIDHCVLGCRISLLTEAWGVSLET